MAKRILAVTLVLTAILALLAGCGGTGGNAPASGAKFSKSDLYLTILGTKYVCDGTIDGMISAFGEDYSYAEAISCAYDGLDKIFTYENLDIYTRPDGERDIVTEICAYDDVESSKNIVIGASADSVRSAYGEPTAENSRLMQYVIPPATPESSGASLYFKLSDGAVTAIGITAEILIGED